jgi:hypothetical protein
LKKLYVVKGWTFFRGREVSNHKDFYATEASSGLALAKEKYNIGKLWWKRKTISCHVEKRKSTL